MHLHVDAFPYSIVYEAPYRSILSCISNFTTKKYFYTSHNLQYIGLHHSTLYHLYFVIFIWVTYGVNMTEAIWKIATWIPRECHMNFMWYSSSNAPYHFCHIDAISNPYKYTRYIQELIRRWDSERELLYDDNIHVEASAYAHWTDLLISTFHYIYISMIGLICANN